MEFRARDFAITCIVSHGTKCHRRYPLVPNWDTNTYAYNTLTHERPWIGKSCMRTRKQTGNGFIIFSANKCSLSPQKRCSKFSPLTSYAFLWSINDHIALSTVSCDSTSSVGTDDFLSAFLHKWVFSWLKVTRSSTDYVRLWDDGNVNTKSRSKDTGVLQVSRIFTWKKSDCRTNCLRY